MSDLLGGWFRSEKAMDYHLLTKKCDGMCDSCECPPAEFECQGEPSLCDNPRGCDCAPRTCEQGCNGCDECTDWGDAALKE